jgi:hypothetical protein
MSFLRHDARRGEINALALELYTRVSSFNAPSSFSFNILRLVNMDCARNFGFVSTAKLRAATADMSSHRQLAT